MFGCVRARAFHPDPVVRRRTNVLREPRAPQSRSGKPAGASNREPASIDFDLDVFGARGGYLVRSSSDRASGEGEADEQIELAAISDLLREARELFESDRSTLRAARVLGLHIFQVLFAGSIRRAWQETVEVAEQAGLPLKTRIRFRHAAELQEIPWELLHDGSRFLALDPGLLISRYVRQFGPLKPIAVEEQLRVLYTQSDTGREPPLETGEELRFMRSLYGRVPGMKTVDYRANATLNDLKGALVRAETRGAPFHIWHHSGHAGSVSGPGGRFLLDMAGGRSEAGVGTEELSEIFEQCSSMRLAVLNTCHGASRDGLATFLADLNLPAVIGHRVAVADEHAIQFTRALYPALLNEPIEAAVATARRRLLIAGNPVEWALPVLFVRGVGACIYRP